MLSKFKIVPPYFECLLSEFGNALGLMMLIDSSTLGG